MVIRFWQQDEKKAFVQERMVSLALSNFVLIQLEVGAFLAGGGGGGYDYQENETTTC